MDLPNNSSTSKTNGLDLPFTSSMLLLFFAVAFSGFIGLVIIRLLGMAFGVDLSELLTNLSDNSSITDRNFFRLTVMINHLTMFVIPGIIICIFLYGKRWMSLVKLSDWPNLVNVLGGVFLLLVSMPFVQFIFWINQNWIPLPEWARTMEASTADTISSLLIADAPYEFLFNVLIIALIPAIGEELIFRGIIQREVIAKSRNFIVGIWISAFIFSAFHMQFEGFFPRLFLGALLGYLYYWSGNLWVPIIAHFMNNFLQILAQYLFQKEISTIDLESIEMTPLWQWMPSLVLIFTVAYFLRQYNNDLKTNISNNTNTTV